MGYRVVKLIAPIETFKTLESRAAVRTINLALINTAIAAFGGLEILQTVNHPDPDPSDPQHEDTGFTIYMQTTDSRHRKFAFDNTIEAYIYPDPPGDDHVSVTEQSRFGTHSPTYTYYQLDRAFISSIGFNFPGNYTWEEVGQEKYMLIYLDDDDNIIGLSNIRIDAWGSEEYDMFLDYAKDMIYMTNGYMDITNGSFHDTKGWNAKMDSKIPSASFVYNSLTGGVNRAAIMPVMLKDGANNFVKYDGTLEIYSIGIDDIMTGYNYNERILIGEQKYIHVGNNNLFLPYDTYEEVELGNG